MTEETLIVLVYFIIYDSFRASAFVEHSLTETLQNLLKNRLIEHHALTVHHSVHIGFCEQFACLEDNTVSTCIERINPQFLIQYLTCENQNM